MSEPVWQFLSDISAVAAADWDACMNSANPFTDHRFLLALEQCGCVGGASGWQPYHLLLYCQQSSTPQLVAVMPMYQKTDSWGEYVFDWAWADAYQRYGVPYYPKLVTAVPFTPVSGNRLAIHPLAMHLTAAIYQQVSAILAGQLVNYSSWHGLFVTAEQSQAWLSARQGAQQLLAREDCQFHWFNRNYQNFGDFLARLTSRKRKNLLKERAQLPALSYHWLTGTQLTPAHWQRFYACYQQTYLKRSGHGGYLCAAFFERLGATMAECLHLLLIAPANAGPEQAFAAVLYVADSRQQVLYGRYWGTLQPLEGLHFEACYYQGIEYAIGHGFACLNAGAQGEHKLIRGFEPVKTYSLHAIADEAFAKAIGQFCTEERAHNQHYMAAMAAALPFRHGLHDNAPLTGSTPDED